MKWFPKHSGNDFQKDVFKLMNNAVIVRTLKKTRNHRDITGYFRHKYITSQNMSSEVHVNNSFILEINYVPFPKYLGFCIFKHPMN